MAKEEKILFFRVFFVISLIFLLNLVSYVYKYGDIKGGFTGFSVKSTVYNAYSGLPYISKMFLIVQWTILILLLLSVAFKDNRLKNQDKEVLSLNLKRKSGANKTDLDTLYEVLKDKKKLRVSTIAKAFNVDPEIALEWGKILESGSLAIIDYPGFGEPVIKIIEKENKQQLASKEIKKDEKKSEISSSKEKEIIQKLEDKKRIIVNKPVKEPRHIIKAKKKIEKMNAKLKKIREKQAKLN
ncbi:MAG: hypothetical protein WC438_04740 [Candidatus Pacearchaeota archaeon]